MAVPGQRGCWERGQHWHISLSMHSNITGSPCPYSLCVSAYQHMGKHPTSVCPCGDNNQFLLPLMEYIPFLSLTASDNEGQFKNHIKIQQPHAHTHSAKCLFHFNISTCVSKEMGGRCQAGYGIFLVRCGRLYILSCDLPQTCLLSDLHKVATIILSLNTVKFWFSCSDAVTVHYRRSQEIICPGPAQAGSIANLIWGDIFYSNTYSCRTSHTFLHE